MHTVDPIVTLQHNKSAVCDHTVSGHTCGFRIGILAENGKIDPQTDSSIVGPPSARKHFFPGDTNILNDFIYIYGPLGKLQGYLDNFKVIPYNLKNPVKVYFNLEYVNLTSLNADGKKNGENFDHVVLSKDNSSISNIESGKYTVVSHADKSCYYDNACQS